LVQALQTRDIVGKTGRLLDVGCGNGAMLRSFSHFLPDWELAGQEVNDRFRDTVISIPQVTDFYVGAVSEIPHEFEFDMITLLHVLEHIPQPLEFLRGLMQKRASNGVIFIQVPNFLNNPYDLLVYDHCSHFTAATLAYLARALPSPTAEAPAEWIHKEWSLCLQPDADSTIHAASQHPPANIQAVEEHLAWLEHVYNRAQSLAQAAHFGIFGTATAGTWLGGVLGEAVDFFTDEDERKWGKTHLTRPVISPQDIPPDSLVFLAFSQELAAQIQVRLQPQYPDITFVLPLEESYDE
jgi:SAM-dependent methyltransferase